ncbi:ATP-binding protein [Kitasatospora sp. NPDC088346]|uniref:ATP-binding protein n=1 Tax=Kitasatospora sp. NPDC088346 TaxID=3364073 RepID=UPI0038195B23
MEGDAVPTRRARAAVRCVTAELGISTAGDPSARDNAESAVLIASELVTNAWRHGHGVMELRLCWDDGMLTLEVDDRGGMLPAVLPAAKRGARGGYGLALVDHLADEWGVQRHPNGKTVWARCALPLAS